MIPLRDENVTARRPVVVWTLISLNILAFLFLQPFSLGEAPVTVQVEQTVFLACRASIPAEITRMQALADAPRAELDRTGELLAQVQRARCPDKSVWLSILMSLFLHGGIAHLGFNMLFLWVFGNNVEDRLGRGAFMAFYLAGGVIATLTQVAVAPSSPTPLIGASGAIASVLGAYLVMFPRARVKTLVVFFLITVIDVPAVFVLALWFLSQVLQGVGPGAVNSSVAYAAHIGGFVAGVIAALAWGRARGVGVRSMRA